MARTQISPIARSRGNAPWLEFEPVEPAVRAAVRDARTDHALEDVLLAILADQIDVGELELEVRDGEATLEGLVASGDDRRLAGELLAGARGVRLVRNRLRVRRDP
jgi:osmotically-inducible protein OsmY